MISIIGVGRVGSAIGFLIASESLDDLVLINRSKYKAVGEALDLTNAVPKDSSMSVTGTDDYELMKGSKVVVVTVSSGKMGATRM
ncbi:MAG: lactate dehydrogenase, partial [Thaumarchaeota archaeon]|nr:lactate dehydrogenase [Nitrososphaerota archaeon]